MRAVADPAIVLCPKPFPALLNYTSLHRSQPAFKDDENNRIYGLALCIEVFGYSWPFLTVEIISGLDLNAKCRTPDGASMTTWKWLRAMVEHEIHHRGQIYIYLALLEVPTPPLYGLTSEQVAERSART